VREVHAGFAGPANPPAHEALMHEVRSWSSGCCGAGSYAECFAAFLEKNPARVTAWDFCVFAGVFEGVLEKSGWLNVVFDGKNVVECVVNVVLRRHLFGS